MITKLSHTSLFVSDQDKAYDFYVNKLGFKVHTDAKMENGFRWLTVTAPEQPELEIVLFPATEKVNGFDESFFMYGEDIDLSLRISQLGYKNYYLGKISITHLKGGSTTYNKKYVQNFYGAMNLFVKKHYNDKPSLYRLCLRAGISVRKMLSILALPFR